MSAAPNRSPADHGFAMPAEWSPQEAVWLSWPVNDPRHWGGSKAERIQKIFASLAAEISRFETVRINVNPGQSKAVEQLLLNTGAEAENIEIFEHQHDDVWCRDHGPIFVKHQETGEVAMTDWEFNAWGGKFEPWDSDNSIPQQIAGSLGIRRFASSMILEGGAIETNGEGCLLTTEAVLLNANRNPQLNREEIESELTRMLGCDQIFWLSQGIEGDDTDGHIDDIARFVAPDVIVAATDRENDQNKKVLDANLERLRSFRRADGSAFEIHDIPLPQACEVPGWRLPILPASYVNFLILNGAVVVPTFRQRKNDGLALGRIAELFPGREIVGFDSLELVEEGGTIHCLTQQQPA